MPAFPPHGPPTDVFCLFGAALRAADGSAYPVIPDVLWSRYPLTDGQDHTGAIVFFAGRLFNRAAVERRAGTPAGASIPATLGHLYRTLGRRCVDELDGYFTLCIVDVAQRTLFAAQDGSDMEFVFHAGVEHGVDRLVVANNIPDVLHLIGAAVEESTLAEYFLFGQLSGAQTMFRGVRRLLVGETLECEAGRCRLDRSRYRQLTAVVPERGPSETELLDRVDAALRERLKTACAGATEVVNTLSGGVDSSYLQWALVEAGHPRSVSVVIEGTEDKHEYALEVARLLGGEHTCHTVSGDELAAAIVRGTRLSATPGSFGGEAAALVLYERLATQAATPPCLVGGDHGDKVFGDGLTLLALRTYGLGLPRWLVDLGLGALLGRKHPGYRGLSKVLDNPRVDPSLVARLWGDTGRDSHVARLLDVGSVAHAYAGRAEIASDVAGPLEHKIWVTRALTSDARTRILWLKNVMAKAHRIRLVEPFADLRILELTWRVPNRMKLRRFTEKYLEKKLLRRRLPRRIVMQHKVSNLTPYQPIMRRSARFRSLLDELRDSRPASLPGFAEHVAWCIAKAERENVIDGDLLLAINFHVWHETWIRDHQRQGAADHPDRLGSGLR